MPKRSKSTATKGKKEEQKKFGKLTSQTNANPRILRLTLAMPKWSSSSLKVSRATTTHFVKTNLRQKRTSCNKGERQFENSEETLHNNFPTDLSVLDKIKPIHMVEELGKKSESLTSSGTSGAKKPSTYSEVL